MNAVVFYVGKNINSNEGYYMNKETIEEAKVEYPNIEFASHSYGLHENFGKTYEEVNNDIMKMKDELTFMFRPNESLLYLARADI